MKLLLFCFIVHQTYAKKRDVMIWTDCSEVTMRDLTLLRHSYTKVAPFNAGVGRDSAGNVRIPANPGLEGCGKAIAKLPLDPVTKAKAEYWPCVGLGNEAGPSSMTEMLDLFASPAHFIADAVNFSKVSKIDEKE